MSIKTDTDRYSRHAQFSRTVKCSYCGSEATFTGATMKECFENEEAAEWQSAASLIVRPHVYEGTCPTCSELPLGRDE